MQPDPWSIQECAGEARRLQSGLLYHASNRHGWDSRGQRWTQPVLRAGIENSGFLRLQEIPLMERLKAQFRAEFFNILNHPNLAAPNFLNDANNSSSTAWASIGIAGVVGSTSTNIASDSTRPEADLVRATGSRGRAAGCGLPTVTELRQLSYRPTRLHRSDVSATEDANGTEDSFARPIAAEKISRCNSIKASSLARRHARPLGGHGHRHGHHGGHRAESPQPEHCWKVH